MSQKSKCFKCPMLAMLEKRISPITTITENFKSGRIEIEVAELEGKTATWVVPQECMDGLRELLNAENIICGH